MGNSAHKQPGTEQTYRKGIHKTNAKQIIFAFGGENYGQLLNKVPNVNNHLAVFDLDENRRIIGNDEHTVSEISCGSYHTVIRGSSGRTFGFGWSEYGTFKKTFSFILIRSIWSC
jgi:alpha-tubulin suppressor-like RCC1 family protein